MIRLVRLLTACLVALPAVAWAAPHPFTVRDLVAMDRLSELQASPDGTRLVFTKSALDSAANRRRTDLWVVNADGTGLKPLTKDPASDTSAAWSPDGSRVFFLSSRSGSSQVWQVTVATGAESQVTKLPLDVGAFQLSRDGARLAVAMEVFVDCDTLECTTARLSAKEKNQSSGQIYDRLFVRHWDSWADGRRSHLFVVPVAGGAPVDVMKGLDADAPSKPFGGTEEFTFTPDGSALVFTARDAGREEAWSTNLDLFVAPIDGKAAPKNLTASNRATDTAPTFSPDGKHLAWVAMQRPVFEADRLRLVVRAWPDGQDRVVTEGWDRSVGEIRWSADGRSVYTTTDNVGHKSLFAIDVASGAARTLVNEGHMGGPVLAANGRIAFLLDHLTSPADIYTVTADGSDRKRVTTANAERLAEIAFGEPEQFSFKGANGDTVYGWIVKPANFDASKKYPIAFLIHGGPQGSFGNDFHYRWNPQTYAGAGYAAVMIDFHGSTGYGQAFTDAIRDDWGGKPLEDLQKGLDAALAKYPFLDGNNACALGASYGGFMVNWIAGAWPDRFKCLVSHDGNLDERAAYYGTEELWFPEWEHKGTPWENPEGYSKHNPVDLVGKWKTPMLVVHGGRDYRIPYVQGLMTFTALQRRGIPSKLLYFPDENHWVLKPANSLLWHDTVLAWIDQWTKGR
jgi:dipeptidyl aminopeptidase/acylaminoacyl peptidase